MLNVSESELQEITYINSGGKKSLKNWQVSFGKFYRIKKKFGIMIFDFRWDNSRCPAVKFQWENQEKIAHLF